MKKRKVLDSNRILKVETTMEADNQLLEHLRSTILGTPGRLRYQLTKIEEKLAHIKKIHFIILTRKDNLLGSVGFIFRNTYCGKEKYKSWYIRYFSIKAPLREKEQKKEKFRNREKGSTLIRDIAMPYMENPGRLEDDFNPKEKSLVYGYVESQNFRSMNFSEQMKGITVRKYKTFIFSRLTLKRVNGVRRLSVGELEGFKKKVGLFYSDYSLFTDENLFLKDNYFILEKDGEPVIGAQIHLEFWRVLDLKGKFSKVMLRILPRLPYIRRIFNPKAFRFLALEGIWYKEGCEKYFNEFFEGLCYQFRIHIALTWVDSKSDLFHALERNLNFGLIGNSFERTEVDVRITFNNYSEEEKKKFFDKPVYISAFDMI